MLSRNIGSFSVRYCLHHGACNNDGKMQRPGGGYLAHLSDGDVPFFRVSFSSIFSRTGYQKNANFLERVASSSGG